MIPKVGFSGIMASALIAFSPGLLGAQDAASTVGPTRPVLLSMPDLAPDDVIPASPIAYTTQVTLEVSSLGKPGACRVKAGSGAAQADRSACLRAASAQFAPARDAVGREMPSVWEGWIASIGSTPAVSPQTSRLIGPGQTGRANYPKKAAREGREGIVYYTARISREGRVIACEITQSSGWADLDEPVCPNMIQRARFTPAVDDAGHPIETSYSSRIVWKLN